MKTPEENFKEESHIIIIGAGLSGLSAAYNLNKNGFKNVHIFEALDRVGGRVYPFKFGDNYLQLGLDQIEGQKGNPLYMLAKEAGVLLENNQREEITARFLTARRCAIKEGTREKFSKLITQLREKLNRSEDDELNSIGEFYEENFLDLIEEENDKEGEKLLAMLNLFQKQIEHEFAAESWNELSFNQWRQSQAFAGQAQISFTTDGVKNLLDYLLDGIPDSVIHYHSPVEKVQLIDNVGLGVVLENGTFVKADHVLVTCPLGYLKEHYMDMFEPQLPSKKKEAIENIGFGTLEKVYLIYDKPFWNKSAQRNIFVRREKCSPRADRESKLSKAFYQFEAHPFHSDVLTTTVTGKYANLVNKATDEKIKKAVTQALKIYTSKRRIRKPTFVIRSGWQKDPYFLGSHSYFSLDAEISDNPFKDLAEPLVLSKFGIKVPLVMFAGEATHSSFFGKAHGAVLTGLREAHRINSYYDELTTKSKDWRHTTSTTEEYPDFYDDDQTTTERYPDNDYWDKIFDQSTTRTTTTTTTKPKPSDPLTTFLEDVKGSINDFENFLKRFIPSK